MTKNDQTLTKADFDPKVQELLKTQDYSPKPKIDGVEIKDLNHFMGEDGYFAELARLKDGQLEGLDGFEVQQISRSVLEAGAIKAFHLHLRQDDVWYVPPTDFILVGLVDLRKDSPTYNQVMKFPLGGTKPRLVRIPKGVGHGAANLSHKPVELIYFTNQQFSVENTDENRLPWDYLGDDFWEMTKE